MIDNCSAHLPVVSLFFMEEPLKGEEFARQFFIRHYTRFDSFVRIQVQRIRSEGGPIAKDQNRSLSTFVVSTTWKMDKVLCY